jgi:hypothetical protein
VRDEARGRATRRLPTVPGERYAVARSRRLLMMVTGPAEMGRTVAGHCAAHPKIAKTVRCAARWMVEMYLGPAPITRRHAVDALADRFNSAGVVPGLSAGQSLSARMVCQSHPA